MFELVLNTATMSCCGYPRSECRCNGGAQTKPQPTHNQGADDDDDFLALPESVVVNEQSGPATTYHPDGSVEESDWDETMEENHRRLGLTTNDGEDVLVPPSLNDLLVNEERAERRSKGKGQRATLNAANDDPDDMLPLPQLL